MKKNSASPPTSGPQANGGHPDFRIIAAGKGKWAIFVLSLQARNWVRKNQLGTRSIGSQDMFKADVAVVNLLLSKSRREGLKTQYVGPDEIVDF